MSADDARPPAAFRPGPAAGPVWPLVLLAVVVALPEAVVLGSDWGLWGERYWRVLAYQYGGFWAGLWQGWQPNYAAQPWVMVASYSALHAGPGHLLGNLAGLWVIGGHLARRFGAGCVLALWGAGVLGGAAMFGILATSAAPMIGASGAVFGLVGGWWVADLAARPRAQPRLRRAARGAAGLGALVLVNVAMDVLTPGGIAWETHLGGFLAGAAVAPWLCRAR